MKNIFERSFIMTNDTKLTFSPLEAELIQNREWILTKQSALHKIEWMLSRQVAVIQSFIPPAIHSHAEIAASRPKISRGEKYLGLPWLMLDYPAVFSKTDVFAVRTMFWWGHFFSVVLHLSGKYKTMYETTVVDRIKSNPREFYLGTGDLEWDHHFGEANFRPAVSVLNQSTTILPDAFLKVALPFPLNGWEQIETQLAIAYKSLFELIEEH